LSLRLTTTPAPKPLKLALPTNPPIRFREVFPKLARQVRARHAHHLHPGSRAAGGTQVVAEHVNRVHAALGGGLNGQHPNLPCNLRAEHAQVDQHNARHQPGQAAGPTARRVKAGSTLPSLEAMKMEFHAAADRDAEVEAVYVVAGDRVEAKELQWCCGRWGESGDACCLMRADPRSSCDFWRGDFSCQPGGLRTHGSGEVRTQFDGSRFIRCSSASMRCLCGVLMA
jgi:biotin carboxyl carrier protein